MKKSFRAIIVVLLSFVGANSLASAMDINIEQATKEARDRTASDNEKTGGSCRSSTGR